MIRPSPASLRSATSPGGRGKGCVQNQQVERANPFPTDHAVILSEVRSTKSKNPHRAAHKHHRQRTGRFSAWQSGKNSSADTRIPHPLRFAQHLPPGEGMGRSKHGHCEEGGARRGNPPRKCGGEGPWVRAIFSRFFAGFGPGSNFFFPPDMVSCDGVWASASALQTFFGQIHYGGFSWNN